jgi:hypothetical protein
VLWYLSKRSATVREIEVFHIALRNAAIQSHQLYRLKQFVLNRPTKLIPRRNSGKYVPLRLKDLKISHFIFGGIKMHYLLKMAFYQLFLGLGRTAAKDTEISESSHKYIVKAPLEAISNQHSGRTLECARFLQKRTHARGLIRKVEDTDLIRGGDGEDEAPEPDGRRGCPELWKFRVKQLKSREVKVEGQSFVWTVAKSSDVLVSGFPFLHPSVTFQVLWAVMADYLKDLSAHEAAVAATERRGWTQDRLRLSDCLGLSDSGGPSTRVILTEGFRCTTELRTGDIPASGAFFVRSTQEYCDDRRVRVTQRESHSIHSFVFMNFGGMIKLVRVLGCFQLDRGKGTLCNFYCCGIIMQLTPPGYLPFDRYQYRLVPAGVVGGGVAGADIAPSIPDIQLFNLHDIVSPAFCVPTNPRRFQATDDLFDTSVFYYCIPPSRVLCQSESYQDLMSRNSPHLNVFRSVADMNDVNSKLEQDVDEFNNVLEQRSALKKAKAAERRREKAAQKRKRDRREHSDTSDSSSSSEEEDEERDDNGGGVFNMNI